MRKKNFHEFVNTKDSGLANAASAADDMQKPVGPFGGTGMDAADSPRLMRALRQMLTTRGVANTVDEKAAARKVLSILRPPVQRLVQMGLEPDDIPLVVQEVINLVIGARGFTGFNQNRVKSALSQDPTNMG